MTEEARAEVPVAWTDEKIREAFIYDGGEAEYHDPINGAKDQRRFAGEVFDRWLAEHDAKVLEAAANEWHEPHDPTTYSASEWLGSRAAAIREGRS